ncbi:MAG: hypothetical protein U9R42_02285 [Bacteroidota bacterium]|nr:hypothetical protein [Bacteroidota bacterium]
MKKNNPFKKIESQEKIPDEVKDKLMRSIHFSQLLTNIFDLFTVKMGETASELFIAKENNNKKSYKLN